MTEAERIAHHHWSSEFRKTLMLCGIVGQARTRACLPIDRFLAL
jgi:hypothetical protein